MMFLLGFITALIAVLIFYIIIRELIFKHGKFIRNIVENELNKLDDATLDKTQIVFPNKSKEIFDNENSTLEDLITK